MSFLNRPVRNFLGGGHDKSANTPSLDFGGASLPPPVHREHGRFDRAFARLFSWHQTASLSGFLHCTVFYRT